MKINKHIITLFTLFIILGSNAQNTGKLKQATKDYDKYSYVKTTDVLLKLAEKGYESQELLQKLGNTYYFNSQMEAAEKWYSKLLTNYQDVDAEYLFRYAQTLKSLEKYNEADQWMQRFTEARGGEKRSQLFNNQKDYLSYIESLSEDFEIKNLDINSEVSDFGSNIYNNQLVFASTRKNGRNYFWNNQPYLNLFTADKQEEGSYTNAQFLSKGVNTRYHESTVAFMPSGDVMYFTRNNFFKSRLKRDEKGINRLKIYSAKLQENGNWGEVTSVHFNSEAYSVAHPAINTSGTKMYFASDMPGTLGESDLYVVDINEDGSLGTPVNLGGVINTEGQETFPFINENGDLYFSSNGRNGLGGLDVYYIHDLEKTLNSGGAFTIDNMGKPINSSMDDFGYYENLETKAGFFTSNRAGGKGDDDIYGFEVPDCLQGLEGKVFDKKTKDILANASLILSDKSGKQLATTTSDAEGAYKFKGVLICNSEYLIRASKETYLTSEERFSSTFNRKRGITQDMYLEMDEVAIAKGTNLREALNLNPIYFDFDKAYIRPDAEIELQKVIEVMKQYPNLKIDVRSHTDSRASKSYNESLSSKRNKATINYLIETGGITADRLTGKGYGESELVNKCSDGVPCTKAAHQLNRRSDFIVVED